MEKVILVDEQDNVLGFMDKLQAHKEGLLHRAFSVFITNKKGEMLLQQRAEGKYHSGGLWTNACCSHPKPDEAIEDAAKRRLVEEMGIDCDVNAEFSFIYKVNLDNNLMEHELDHVLTAEYEGEVDFNKEEVMAYKWVSINNLLVDVNLNPQDYTEWFKIIVDRVIKNIKKKEAA